VEKVTGKVKEPEVGKHKELWNPGPLEILVLEAPAT
jgi:hypothetical protein